MDQSARNKLTDNESIQEKIQRFSKNGAERASKKRERIESTLAKFNYNHQVNFKASHAFSVADGKWLTKDEQKTIDEMERE